MKRLSLIRHAKAEPADRVPIPDRERPLTERGRRDAEMMGTWLFRTVPTIERFLVSPAMRTRQTAELILQAWQTTPPPIHLVEELYLPTLDQLLAVVWSLEPTWESVAIVGHNPSLAELRDYLIGTSPDSMPTCAVAVVTIATDSWLDVRQGSAHLEHYRTPKQ